MSNTQLTEVAKILGVSEDSISAMDDEIKAIIGLVSQFGLFDALILGNQFLDRLLALWLHIMVFLQLSLGIPQEFHEGCRQCTGRQLAGIDDQGNRFVFDLFLHGNLPSLSE